MEPVKIAQIGVGHDHAIFTFCSLIKLTDCFDVVGIVPYDKDDERIIKESPVYSKYPMLSLNEALNINGLEAVAIETTEISATAAAQIFAEKGIAVHLDKPGTANLNSFKEFIDTCRKNNSPLQMGYMYRFNPAVIKAISDIKAGKLGKIYSVEAHMSIHHTDGKRRWVGQFKGGMMYFLGCHLVDICLQIKGTPKSVIALNAATDKDFINSEDYGFAVLNYDDGVSFVKTCSNEINGFSRRRVTICGTKGTIVISPIEAHCTTDMSKESAMHAVMHTTLTDYEDAVQEDCSKSFDTGPFDRYDNMMREFANITAGEIINPYSYDYELKLFETIMKCCGF